MFIEKCFWNAIFIYQALGRRLFMIYKSQYRTKVGFHCGLGCFRNYCHYRGIDLEEEEIFFIGNGFFLSYQEFQIPEGMFFTLSMDIFESLFSFCRQYDVSFIDGEFVNEAEAMSLLKNGISKDRCLSINIAPIACNYRSVLLGPEKMAQPCHSAVGNTHFVNPIGLNAEETEIFISDSCVPSFHSIPYHGWANFYDIKKGWGKANFEFFIFEEQFWKRLAGCIRDIDKQRVLMEKFMSGLTGFLNAPDCSENQYTGIKALFKIHRMFQTIDHFPNRNQLVRFFFREWVNESVTYHYYTLAVLKKVLPQSGLESEIQELISKWEQWLLQMLKSSFNNQIKSIRTLTYKLEILIDKEITTYTKIMRICEVLL
ncbi:MAG: hypothetical protein C5B47_02385 [Verrucomicrobia bacterium]|nr:MAG: hypothetical protein C5B47_02385 [Verrucomicrobiota bacterium]